MADLTALAELPGDPNLIAFDVLHKKPILTTDELGKATRSLYKTRCLTKEEIAQIRKRLTFWADSIPHHSIREFGQRIQISHADFTPYYWLTLQSLYESRHVERKEEPYRGDTIASPLTSESNIQAWSYNLLLPDDYTSTHTEFRVEDSQEIRDCSPCMSSGKVTCVSCSGKGRTNCPTCDAAGNVPCPACGGHGLVIKYHQEIRFRERTEWRTITKYRRDYHGNQEAYTEQEPYQVQEQYTEDVPVQESCPSCAGRGTVVCQTCNGTREVLCETCVGTGLVICSHCDGQGKVVSYLSIQADYKPSEDNQPLANPLVPYDCQPLLDSSKDYAVLLWLNHSVFSPSVTEAIENPDLKVLLKRGIENSKSARGENQRIIRQSISIQRANIVYIRYTFDRSDYDLCLIGRQLQVHAPNSPISKATASILIRAMELLDSEDVTPGLVELSKVYDMRQNEKKANDALEAFRAKLSAAYMSEANNLSNEGLWPDSLYYSDRAGILFPFNPEIGKHETRIGHRVAALHVGIPLAIALATGSLAYLFNKPLIGFASLATLGLGLVSHFAIGTKIRGTTQALVHGSIMSVALSLGIITPIYMNNSIIAVWITASITILDLILFKCLSSSLMREQRPAELSSNPQEAIRQIEDFLERDWHAIRSNFQSLQHPSFYGEQFKELETQAKEQHQQLEAQADQVIVQRREHLSGKAQEITDLSVSLLPKIVEFLTACQNQNIRKVQSLRTEIQESAISLKAKIADFEKQSKRFSKGFSVKHETGRKSRVKVEMTYNQGSLPNFIVAMKAVLQGAAILGSDFEKALSMLPDAIAKAVTALGNLNEDMTGDFKPDKNIH